MSAGTEPALVLDLAGEAATEAAGRALARGLQAGDLLALCGDLGAGKTTLVRGLAAGLGVEPGVVRSPSFVLHHVYRGRPLILHHLDLYRLGRPAALDGLDLESLLAEGAVAVEWGDNADLEALGAVRVELEVPSAVARRLSLGAAAPARLRRALEEWRR